MFLNFLSLCAIMLTLIVTSPLEGTVLTAVGLLITVLAMAAVLLQFYGHRLATAPMQASHGPEPDERRLRGSFRRSCHPDTPGRPRPRAPGLSAGTL
ncbi:DUF6412 domain-containing protein [Rhodococcus sp. NPDC058521]|uniref:DUF6412 domain-containing protein n=1 Tax=Rhodococcus sp. NPDC058521 TaxID=3346536 RepID=UPI00364DF850